MIGYLEVGHLWVYGGTAPPKSDRVNVGLLGADYTVDHDRFRFAKIYNGENWNPGLHAPLTQPGVNVKVGDYLLAVNGKGVHADREVQPTSKRRRANKRRFSSGPIPTAAVRAK